MTSTGTEPNKTVSFYYVRHGRTEFNRDGIIQGGSVDSPLAEETVYVVEETAQALAGIPFARCFTSPLGRARQTAGILCAPHPGLEAVNVDGLREFDFGELDGKSNREAANARRFSRCFMLQDYSSVGGESGGAVRNRVRRTFQEMFDASNDGDQVLVVAHGSLMRYVLLEFLPAGKLARMVKSRTLKTPNASIAHLTAKLDPQTRKAQVILDQLPLRAQEFQQGGKGTGHLY